MTSTGIDTLLQHICQLVSRADADALSDSELLSRFAEQRDELAFVTLMHRHGRLVQVVCQRMLRDIHDVEDAFQTTFVALGRQAKTIRRQSALSSWLYEVAFNAATAIVRGEAPRRIREKSQMRSISIDNTTDDVTLTEVREVVDLELHELPEQYRRPLVCCYFAGLTHAKGASELGIPERTYRRRLERGRQLLHRRLSRRGLALSLPFLGGLLETNAASGGVSSHLMIRTLRAATAAIDSATAAAPDLAARAIKSTLLRQSRFKATVVVTALAVVGGAAWFLRGGPDEPSPSERPINVTSAAADLAKSEETSIPASDARQKPTAAIWGRVLDPTGKPLADADVAALARRPFQNGEHGLRDDVVARGKTDAAGRFRLIVPTDFPTWYSERKITILAHAPGHSCTTLRAPLEATAPSARINGSDDAVKPPGELEVRLSQGEAAHGKLVDPDGKPAAGVLLRVIRLGDAAFERIEGSDPSPEPAGWPIPVTSGDDGSFELTGLAGNEDVWVQVDDERFATRGIRLKAGESPRPFVLSKATILEGRIVAGDTGLPLAGARLTAGPDARPLQVMITVSSYQDRATRERPFTDFDARTDRDGRFRFRLARGAAFVLQIHAPERSPYLSVYRRFAPGSDSELKETRTFALPRGILVEGDVTEAGNGKSLAQSHVTWDAPVNGNPGCGPELIQGFGALVQTDATGHFAIVSPSAAARLLVYGPTQDFIAHRCNRWVSGPVSGSPEMPQHTSDRSQSPAGAPAQSPGAAWELQPASPFNTRAVFAHAEVRLDLVKTQKGEAVHLRLQRGRSIEGELLDPDGQPAKSAVMICSGRVGPIFPSVVLPMDVKDGRFSLPGCEDGSEYSVVFLDSAHDCGAVATLRCSEGAAPTRIQLAPCGKAKVRMVDQAGRPVKGALPHLFLRMPRSIRLDESPPPPRTFDLHDGVRIDPVYRDGMHSDGDGYVELHCLVPGVRYQLSAPDGPKPIRSPFLAPAAEGRAQRPGPGMALSPSDGPRKLQAPFTVRPAEVRTLPDLIVERRAAKQ